MELAQVRKEIEKQAKERAKELEKETETQINLINKEIEDKATEYREKRKAETQKKIDTYEVQKKREAQSVIQKRYLETKKDILDRVFDEAMDILENSKDRKKHIQTLSKVDFPAARKYIAKQDVKKVRGGKEADISGGVILENKAGDVRVDLSYDTLMQNVHSKYLQEVEKVLFP